MTKNKINILSAFHSNLHRVYHTLSDEFVLTLKFEKSDIPNILSQVKFFLKQDKETVCRLIFTDILNESHSLSLSEIVSVEAWGNLMTITSEKIIYPITFFTQGGFPLG